MTTTNISKDYQFSQLSSPADYHFLFSYFYPWSVRGRLVLDRGGLTRGRFCQRRALKGGFARGACKGWVCKGGL